MIGDAATSARRTRQLTDIVGPAHLLTEPFDRAPHEIDWTGRFRGSTFAVARPGDVAQVEALVAWCRGEGVAMVPQGGNTGLVGGGVPLHGELVVSLRRLDSIGPVEINVVRYGATREQVVGVEAVLGTGSTVRRLAGLVKDNTGYHLPGLLCGSEGTLGVVTAARLRLVTAHDARATALVAFESVDRAVAAVAAWRSSLDCLEAAELMLAAGVDLVCATFGLAAPFSESWPALVLVEVAAHDDPTDELGAALEGVEGVEAVAVAPDASRRAALWRYREDHTLAINTLGPPHKFDVTIPAAALAEFATAVPGHVAQGWPAARTWQFGHVGDGNLHVNVTGVDPDDEALDEHVLRFVVGFGGSISAEHGIGTAKAQWLALDRSTVEIAAMRAIKAALDPDGILNPHSVLP